MLNSIKIKNFALIEDLDISFGNSINVIMGETGSGKSILVEAISLLKGEKSDFEKIRNGQTKAFIEGSFYLENKELIASLNDEFDDLIGDDQLLVVTRTLTIDGKSNVKINYRSVPLNLLKRVMSQILDLFSQHKDHSYFDETLQINYLDEYGKLLHIKDDHHFLSEYLSNYQNLYQNYLNLLDQKTSLEKKIKQVEDIDYLQYQCQEIENASLQENEIEEIDDRIAQLENIAKIEEIYHEFDENYQIAIDHLYRAKKVLNTAKDDIFANATSRINSLYYDLDDAHDEIKNKFHHLSSSLDELDDLKNRKMVLANLKRKYGKSTKEILDKLSSIKENIAFYENGDEKINALNQEIAKQEEILEKTAADISLLREKTRVILKEKIDAQLSSLELKNASFDALITRTNLHSLGYDQVQFVIKTNIGSKYLPLNKCASLGETSRINLALKTIFNQIQPLSCLIFDEIDTGISGRIGLAVAHKIKEISKMGQIIIISHLPQIASLTGNHYLVSKIVENNNTKTLIKELNEEESLKEIAKMISGHSDQTSLDSAINLRALVK